jgi:hypothetical protein
MSIDRVLLSSTRLPQLAARERIELRQVEKDRVSADYLYFLAITKKRGLNQHDRDRLKPLHLAHLAVTQKIVLSQEDKSRLPMALLFALFDQGIVELSEHEMACYNVAQLESLKELKAAHSESLVPV